MVDVTKQLLMTGDYPEGWKLEELLNKIQDELIAKNNKLNGDVCPVSTEIRSRNSEIIYMLGRCEELQLETMRSLDSLGIDPGPGGKPRIGE